VEFGGEGEVLAVVEVAVFDELFMYGTLDTLSNMG